MKKRSRRIMIQNQSVRAVKGVGHVMKKRREESREAQIGRKKRKGEERRETFAEHEHVLDLAGHELLGDRLDLIVGTRTETHPHVRRETVKRFRKTCEENEDGKRRGSLKEMTEKVGTPS